MNTMNFTKRALESLPTPDADRYVVHHDSVERGLGIKIEPSGHRVYFWSRRVCGRLMWKTIGDFADVTLDEARAAAAEHNRARVTWKQTGEVPLARAGGLTLRDVIAQYVERRIRHETKNPERAVRDVEGQRDRCLTRLLDRKVASIRPAEIVDLREEVSKKRGKEAANRLMQLLRAALNWSIHKAHLWAGPNPVKNIDMFKRNERIRFLQPDELVALRDALAVTENRDLVDAVRLSLMTGARKTELLSMRWSDIALDRGTWTVPEPKNEKPYTVALTVEAVDILRARRAFTGDSVWVFPSATSESGRLMDCKRGWHNLLRRAKIADFHWHDLRHTFASYQAAGGASLLVIGASLGHKSLASTKRYSHLVLDVVRSSVQSATATMFPATPEPKMLPAASARKKAARR